MRPELIDRCLMLIETKFAARSKSLPEGGREMWERVLADTDDELGCKALGTILMYSPWLPEWSAFCEGYAELIGAAPGETPDEAVARHNRQAEYRERQAAERERFREECRQKYGPIMADPVLRREWFRSHSSEGLPFADLVDVERREATE